MTTSVDATYEISHESAEDVSEDHVNVVARFSEGPNLGSEDLNFTDSSSTSKGKPRCITQYFNLLQFYIYILYLALSLGVEMEPEMHASKEPMYCARVLIE
jgi:hypothetical protein